MSQPSTNHLKFGASGISSATRGGFSVGVTNGADYGPTSTTGFWNGVKPPVGGYTIYVDKASQGPSIHVASNDSQCIGMLLAMGATGSTIGDVLAWAAGQSNMAVLSEELVIGDLPGAGPSIVSSGLVLNLDASNPSSYPGNGNTWTDLSNNAYVATLTNGASYSSANGGSIAFSAASSNYVNIPNSIIPTGNTSKTMGIWFKSTGTISNRQWLIYAGSETTGGRFCLEIESSKLTFNFYDSALSSVSTLTDNTWYYGTVAYNSSENKAYLYINGSLSNEYQFPYYLVYVNTDTTVNTQIGRYSGASLYLTGNVGSIQIYNTYLSAADVLQNYNATKTRFGF